MKEVSPWRKARACGRKRRSRRRSSAGLWDPVALRRSVVRIARGRPGRPCRPSSSLPKAERGIQRRQWRAEEEPALDSGQERRLQDERERFRHEPLHDRVAASLTEQHRLGAELKAMQRPYVILPEALDRP